MAPSHPVPQLGFPFTPLKVSQSLLAGDQKTDGPSSGFPTNGHPM